MPLTSLPFNDKIAGNQRCCGGSERVSADSVNKGTGCKSPRCRRCKCQDNRPVGESQSLGQPEKAGRSVVGGTSQKTYKICAMGMPYQDCVRGKPATAKHCFAVAFYFPGILIPLYARKSARMLASAAQASGQKLYSIVS